MSQTETEEKKYPGVDLAYPLALESYEWAAKRFDTLDSRIQTILGLGISLTLAVPIALSALKLSINGRWFVAAAVLFVLALSLGTYARLMGKLTVITPEMLYQKWLHLSDWEFKKNLIFFAGEHFNKNRNLLEKRHRFAAAATFIFFLEVLALAVSVSCRP